MAVGFKAKERDLSKRGDYGHGRPKPVNEVPDNILLMRNQIDAVLLRDQRSYIILNA